MPPSSKELTGGEIVQLHRQMEPSDRLESWLLTAEMFSYSVWVRKFEAITPFLTTTPFF